MTRLNLADIPQEFLDRNPELVAALKTGNPAKYHNVKTDSAGMTFASGHEAVRIGELILAEQHHEVFGLRLQVRFPLPGAGTYVADAVYSEIQDGKLSVVVEDAKGVRTELYRRSAKQFKARYGIEIREV